MNVGIAGETPFDGAQGKPALRNQVRTATTTAKAPSFPTGNVGTQNARKLAATSSLRGLQVQTPYPGQLRAAAERATAQPVSARTVLLLVLFFSNDSLRPAPELGARNLGKCLCAPEFDHASVEQDQDAGRVPFDCAPFLRQGGQNKAALRNQRRTGTPTAKARAKPGSPPSRQEASGRRRRGRACATTAKTRDSPRRTSRPRH